MHCRRRHRTLHTKVTFGIKQFSHNKGLVFFSLIIAFSIPYTWPFSLVWQGRTSSPRILSSQCSPHMLCSTSLSFSFGVQTRKNKKPLSQTAQIFKFPLANNVSSTCWFGTCPRSFQWTGKVGGICGVSQWQARATFLGKHVLYTARCQAWGQCDINWSSFHTRLFSCHHS